MDFITAFIPNSNQSFKYASVQISFCSGSPLNVKCGVRVCIREWFPALQQLQYVHCAIKTTLGAAASDADGS